ncbi:hypothetical protein RHS03_05779, partial [Rhizoctonia solani]
MLSALSYPDVGSGLRLWRRPPCPFPSHALTWSHSARQAKGNEQEISVVTAMGEELGIQRMGNEEEGGRGGQARRARDEAIAGGEEAAAGRADGRTEGGEDRQKAEEEDKRKGKGLKNMTRAVEESSELKSVAGRLGRKLCTRVGQVASSQSELGRLVCIFNAHLKLPSHPIPTETGASQATDGLPAETSGVAGGGEAPCKAMRDLFGEGHRPNRWMGSRHAHNLQGRSNVHKMIDRELEGKNDPDDKPPTLETTSQYTDRMVVQLVLYAAILQTSPMPAQIEPDSVPAQFRLAKLWT